MTTEKQIKANQANSKKSTGAVTSEGKAIVASNAIKHGLFSSRLILTDESHNEYGLLLDDLIHSLQPVGALELVLVEKIATAIWRQLRMTKAESVSIELDRRIEKKDNRSNVGELMGYNHFDSEITLTDFSDLTDSDKTQIEWLQVAIDEYKAIPDSILYKADLNALQAQAVNLYGQLVDEAEAEGMTIDEYVAYHTKTDSEGLWTWANEMFNWCEKELAKYQRRSDVRQVAEQMRMKQSAPMHNELLIRYQTALDAELYKAIEALRKQQEWRSKSGYLMGEVA
jgi:hypothetical protein